jgi:hypothetical protein
MKINMGTADRIIRLMIAAIIGVLFYMKIITGTPGIVLGVIAAVFLLTSIAGFCPLYALFGIKTCKAS